MISVLIPVKNEGDDLRRCLERIQAQNVEHEVEPIVVDSGSSDGSVELAYEAAKFTGLRLGVHHKRLPASVPPRLSALGNYWSTTR